MPMGERSATLSGPPSTTPTAPAFVVPLTLDMAGQWVAKVALTAPGRPEWQTSLRFTLLPTSAAATERSGA